MTLRFSGEQFGPTDYRGRVEIGAHSFEFRSESIPVLLSMILDTYDAAMGRVDAPEAPEEAAAAPEPAEPARTVPRRRK